MEKKDLKRILQNFDELDNKFEQLDEQIDESLRVSPETLRKTIII